MKPKFKSKLQLKIIPVSVILDALKKRIIWYFSWFSMFPHTGDKLPVLAAETELLLSKF